MKKFRPEQYSNPWPLQYQCNLAWYCRGLPTELSSLFGPGHIPVDEKEIKWIYGSSHILFELWSYEDMIDHHNYTHNLSSCEIKAGFNFTISWVVWLYNCDDQSYLHIFPRSSNIWSFIYYSFEMNIVSPQGQNTSGQRKSFHSLFAGKKVIGRCNSEMFGHEKAIEVGKVDILYTFEKFVP